MYILIYKIYREEGESLSLIHIANSSPIQIFLYLLLKLGVFYSYYL